MTQATNEGVVTSSPLGRGCRPNVSHRRFNDAMSALKAYAHHPDPRSRRRISLRCSLPRTSRSIRSMSIGRSAVIGPTAWTFLSTPFFLACRRYRDGTR